MKTKIKFVRMYEFYGNDYIDVVYKTNRIFTIPLKEAPKTAVAFMAASKRIEHGYDRVFKRDETLYY